MSPLPTHISETVLRIFCIISSSKISSIESGIVSFFSFAPANTMISSLVGVMDLALVAARLERCNATSSRMCSSGKKYPSSSWNSGKLGILNHPSDRRLFIGVFKDTLDSWVV